MGGNNNQQSSNADPRGRQQNQQDYQQQRFESQQGPAAEAMGYNYGRGSEADYANYMDIMNQYRDIASGATSSGGGGSVGYAGDVSYLQSPGTYHPQSVTYNDPYASYNKFQELSQTGGYSPEDMANLRARGASPVRAAYANAEREIGRQRALSGQGANTTAALARMAREQSQGMSDAMQNVEAGIIGARNQGRLAGMQGMTGIENQRLAAQIGTGEFNAQQLTEAEKANINQAWELAKANSAIQQRNLGAQQGVASQNASMAAQAAQADMRNRLGALGGMAQLYGTTPGMSQMFGNQLNQTIGQGGSFGTNLIGAGNQMQQLPGAYDTWMGRASDISNMAYPWLNRYWPQGGGGQMYPTGGGGGDQGQFGVDWGG